MKKILLFDLDHTLIDTDIIKKRTLADISKSFGVELAKIEEARDKYYGGLKSTSDINPDEMLGVIQKELGLPLAKLKAVFYNPEIFKSAIYPDTKEMLKKIAKGENRLGIFSEGLDFYQKFKMEATGLAKYFDEKLFWVSRRKKSLDYIRLLPEGAIVVDDKIDVAKVLKKSGRVEAIWLNRKDSRVSIEVRTIFKLTELEP